MDFQTMTIEEVIKYNNDYKQGKFAGSEARPYDLENITKFIKDIRPTYKYVDEYSQGNWVALDIKTSHSKYGTNYICIDHDRKLWRTRQTMMEFYPGGNVYD